jgi:phenylacetate-CoA ligase
MATAMYQPRVNPVETERMDYEALRQRQLLDMRSRIPALMQRLDWAAERLKTEREARLRTLVTYAKTHSPWYRERLADVNSETLNEETLKDIPPTSKNDLMDHFDAISTDLQIRRDACEAHLKNLKSDAYLFDRYHVCASGGSTGRRGLVVWGWNAWADGWAMFLAHLGRLRARDPSGAPARSPIVGAGVCAQDPMHMSSALQESFSDPGTMLMHSFPVTLRFDQIVAGIGALQPDIVTGYPPMLHRLAMAQQDGQISITPKLVVGVSEPLLPEIRAMIAAAWDTRILNFWATTEGMTMAMSCGFGPGMHLNDDQLIIEPVDTDGRPVAAGARASKICVTNLINTHPLPLIRYEITDEVTLLEGNCRCGSAHRLVDDIQGRLDDSFTYAGLGTIHPHVFRSRLGRERHVVEYQVTQTPHGATIVMCCNGEVDLQHVRQSLVGDLRRLGLSDPQIELARVETIERVVSGKLKRFVPLPHPLH